MKRWEISLLVGVFAVILWCAAPRLLTASWWTSAFSPLCDSLLCAEGGTGDVVLRSRLWELAEQYIFGCG